MNVGPMLNGRQLMAEEEFIAKLTNFQLTPALSWWDLVPLSGMPEKLLHQDALPVIKQCNRSLFQLQGLLYCSSTAAFLRKSAG